MQALWTTIKVLLLLLAGVVVILLILVCLHLVALEGIINFSKAAHEPIVNVELKEAPTPRPPTSSAKYSASTYTVKKGDTLEKIARAHGVTPEELSKLNNLDDPNRIHLAQVLRLPREKLAAKSIP